MAMTRLRVEMAKRLGMSEIEGLAVAYIRLHGELGQARLGELLDLSPGGTAALVQRLETENRVVRRPGQADRRMRLISLSPGMAALLTALARPTSPTSKLPSRDVPAARTSSSVLRSSGARDRGARRSARTDGRGPPLRPAVHSGDLGLTGAAGQPARPPMRVDTWSRRR